MKYEILVIDLEACEGNDAGAEWYFCLPWGYKLFSVLDVDVKKGRATLVVYQGGVHVENPLA